MMSIYQFDNEQDEADYEIAMGETARRRARAILDRDEQFKDFYISSELDLSKFASFYPRVIALTPTESKGMIESGDMSDQYVKQIEDLRDWYKLRLPAFGKIILSDDEYKAGTDSLEGFHADLIKAAFVEWLAICKYELSYNQGCIAFFSAAKDLELLEVQPCNT